MPSPAHRRCQTLSQSYHRGDSAVPPQAHRQLQSDVSKRGKKANVGLESVILMSLRLWPRKCCALTATCGSNSTLRMMLTAQQMSRRRSGMKAPCPCQSLAPMQRPARAAPTIQVNRQPPSLLAKLRRLLNALRVRVPPMSRLERDLVTRELATASAAAKRCKRMEIERRRKWGCQYQSCGHQMVD